MDIVTVQPTSEPITTADAKTHLRVDISDDDQYIAALIRAARQSCENYCARAFITQTRQTILDSFYSCDGGDAYGQSVMLRLGRAPVISLTSITYVDMNGATQTLDPTKYQVDLATEPARILPVYGSYWPVVRPQLAAVTVTYQAGYGAASAVPDAIKHAMRILISHWYENREPVIIGSRMDVLPMTVEHLLGPYRIISF